MEISKKELQILILDQKDSLVPIEYYTYPIKGIISSFIFNIKEEPKVVSSTNRAAELVDTLIKKAVEALKISHENKTGVMCEVQINENEKLKVYFYVFDNRRVICTKIQKPKLTPIKVPS